MGNVLSFKKDTAGSNGSQDQSQLIEDYVTITNDTSHNKQSPIEFDPAKSFAICVGIDQLQNYNSLGNSLGIAAKNATLLGKALEADMGLQKEHVLVYTTAKEPELCKKEAIKALILNYAYKVEENGLLVFHFSGNVAVYKSLDERDEWVHVLSPGDFTGDVISGITADDFVDWIQEANCKARHILIILDCCCAGGIGKKITSKGDVKPQIHVMCACAAEEVTLPLNILGSSIFCYFLLHILKKNQPKGKFALNEDMHEIAELCQSFSSLLMCYSSERGGILKSALIQPELHSSGSDEIISCDETDDGNNSRRLNMLFGLYDKQAQKPSLHPTAYRWLRSNPVQESLRLLFSVDPLPESLYNGIWCAFFYSVACIHLAYDRTHVAERNLLITVAISIMSAIGYSYPDVSITVEQLTLGLKYYYMPVNSEKITTTSIEKLFMDLHVYGGGDDQNTVSMV